MRLYIAVSTIAFTLIASCSDDNSDEENSCPEGLEYCQGSCVAPGTCQAQTAGTTSGQPGGGGGTNQFTSGAGGAGNAGGQGGTSTQPVAGSTAGNTGGVGGQGGTSTQPVAGSADGGSGAAGGSGTGGSGPVDTGDANALSCPDGVTIPAEDVISDFAQSEPTMYKTDSRGGTIWQSWSETTPATLTIDTANPGPCNSGGSLRIEAAGTDKESGEGVGIDFQPQDANKKKSTYDAAAAGYTGVGFWAKCSPERSFIYIKVLDAANDADVPTASGGAPCSYSSEPICSQYGIKNVTITDNEWGYYKVYFSELLQDPKTGSTWGEMGGLDPSKVASFQFQINTPYDTSGGARVPTPSNCWVDDVHFIKDTAPEPQTTCAAGYTVSGNKIVCGTETKIFRGVARPSMEWDSSGWNITPWDMARIKGWKANLIRFSLNQDYYMNQFPDIYPKYVARSVRWAEAAGMDVILDLHWVDNQHQTPTDNYMASAATNSTAFWAKVAAAYKSDPHVIFELYNEPTIKDWSAWKTNFQAMYDAVRGAGANNIVIIGGLDWAYDLTGVSANAINGTNIAYNTHPYGNKAPSGDWDGKFGYLAATYPLFATEFGTYDCSGDWTRSLITYMEGKGMSWTAWAWYVAPTGQECQFPSIISDYSGTLLPGGNAQAAKDGLVKNP
ncbi:MAG: glycoside hydrolase family 5 protein [Deltaproteobacteria bacterium]|nr:glycoside hydrolase family 5 protein [Deltaproteobacteria bacterium]